MVIGSGGHCWETAGVVIVESRSACSERIEDRGVDDLVSVSSELVASEGVCNDPDDVHELIPLLGSAESDGRDDGCAASPIYTNVEADFAYFKRSAAPSRVV